MLVSYQPGCFVEIRVGSCSGRDHYPDVRILPTDFTPPVLGWERLGLDRVQKGTGMWGQLDLHEVTTAVPLALTINMLPPCPMPIVS